MIYFATPFPPNTSTFCCVLTTDTMLDTTTRKQIPYIVSVATNCNKFTPMHKYKKCKQRLWYQSVNQYSIQCDHLSHHLCQAPNRSLHQFSMFPNYQIEIKHLEQHTLSGIRAGERLSQDCLILYRTFINVKRKLGGKMAGVLTERYQPLKISMRISRCFRFRIRKFMIPIFACQVD